MAPEVLSKGTAYDSSADWFSFGCMLYKLLKGHSPFRQHKTKDKHEIDRMTLTMNVELPDTFSCELKHLLESLLQVRELFCAFLYMYLLMSPYMQLKQVSMMPSISYPTHKSFFLCNRSSPYFPPALPLCDGLFIVSETLTSDWAVLVRELRS